VIYGLIYPELRFIDKRRAEDARKLRHPVIEFGVVQRFGRELAGGLGINRFIRVEADKGGGAIGKIVVDSDHAGVFIVDLAALRLISPDRGIRCGRNARRPGLKQRRESRRKRRRLRAEGRRGNEADLGSIQSLAKTLIVQLKEGLAARDGPPSAPPN
jgi:hypothetical protein